MITKEQILKEGWVVCTVSDVYYIDYISSGEKSGFKLEYNSTSKKWIISDCGEGIFYGNIPSRFILRTLMYVLEIPSNKKNMIDILNRGNQL